MSATNQIPLVDLQAQHAEVADEVLAGFATVLKNTSFIGGPDVAAFESEFAEYCAKAHCVGVANGTDAIELALRALDIGRGDEVILPANTFIATAEAVARAGADVVLVDCTNDTLLIDPALVADRLHQEVELGDLAVEVDADDGPGLRGDAFGDERITLIEDAAQSQGALRHGAPIGAGVAAAATSFYPGKNLGAYGDAGAVVSDDAELAHRVRAIGGHGGVRRYEHDFLGFNSRLDTLQAVVLRAKLRRLDGWNEHRREAAVRYAQLLADVENVTLPTTASGNLPVWHLFVVRVPDRDRVLAELHAGGIGAGIHYPQPVHLTGAFAGLGLGSGSFPVAEQSAPSLLTLPLFPHITEAQQERVVEVLIEALR